MNGPDHYRAGEAYLDRVVHLAETDSEELDTAPVLLAIAQTHFAAAQVAATALAATFGDEAPSTAAAFEWRQAIRRTDTTKEA